MGAWGTYDDENDYVADVWVDIERKVMPKSFEEVSKSITKDHSLLNTLRREYAINNPKKLYIQIEKWIAEHKKYMKKYKENEREFDTLYGNIVGVCLKAIRTLQKLPASDPLGSGIFSSLIPETLPRGYPESLRTEALKSLKILIDRVDKNLQGWKHIESRKMTLQHELFLFSKGKQGIKGKHPKPIKQKHQIIIKKSSKKSN